MATPTPGVVVSDVPAAGSRNQFDGEEDEAEAWHILTVTCDDRAGLLADLSEHIRFCGVDIVRASVATDTESGLIVDSFAVRERRAAFPRDYMQGSSAALRSATCAQRPALPEHVHGRPPACALRVCVRLLSPVAQRSAHGGLHVAAARSCPAPSALAQVRDAITGGKLPEPLLESLSSSLWQVALGAAHPKRLSGGASTPSAAPAPQPSPAAARRAGSGNYNALSLTTVAEVRRILAR